MDRPYTVESLAEHWSCKKHAIYALIRSGRLPAFRLGGKLLRIRAEVVEAWESAGAGARSITRRFMAQLRHERSRVSSVQIVDALLPALSRCANVLDMKIKRKG